MTFKTRLFALALGGLALAAPLTANAHRGWIIPTATVLSGDVWVSFDAAVSNELFYADHNPLRTDGVIVTAPDGAIDKIQNALTAKYRSTFDVQLSKPGTYKIGTASQSVMASWTEAGVVKRFRGSPEDFAKQVPAGAADLKTIKSFNRNETFVTRDAPTTTVFKPTGKGLEFEPITHPNAIAMGETARFRFLVDGRPAAGVKVTVLPGGDRYREEEGARTLTTGADGVVAVTWPAAGMYWLGAEAEDKHPTEKRAETRRMSYAATLEVMTP